MNRLLLLAAILLLCLPNKALTQNFEGVITYKIDFDVLPSLAKMGVTKAMMMEKMKNQGWADTEKITYKGGSYRVNRMSTKRIWDIYRSESNKIYTFQDSSNLCTILDAAVDLEATMLNSEPTITLVDTIANIFNKPCRMVHVQWKSGYFDYFFSDNFLPMNPELYKYHKYNDWYNYLKIAKALPIQFKTVVNDMMIVTYTMTSFKDEMVQSDIFKIPELTTDEEDLSTIPNQVIMKIKN